LLEKVDFDYDLNQPSMINSSFFELTNFNALRDMKIRANAQSNNSVMIIK
tara:strand:- start:92 stop:241 length:150 start_codon:yes stop_codon:yes gene_type:complete